MGSYHAAKSPSSSHRWGGGLNPCTASIREQYGHPNKSSQPARLGTTGHQLSAEVLDHDTDPQSYLGRTLDFIEKDGRYIGEAWAGEHREQVTHSVTVDQALIDACVMFINFVRELVETTGGTLHVEQRLPIDHITGEGQWHVDGVPVQEGLNDAEADVPDGVWHPATGASDITIVTNDTITTVDLKLGRGKVTAYEVIRSAMPDPVTGEMQPEVVEPNSQLAMYNSSAARQFGDRPKRMLIICQPFIHNVSSYSCTADELEKLIDRLRVRSRECDESPVYSPSFDNCFFCRAKDTCAERTRLALALATNGLEDVEVKPIDPENIGVQYQHLPFIRDWCDSVERVARKRLEEGQPVVRSDGIGYKLIDGPKGDREWSDKAVAEETLRKARLKKEQMYSMRLISPAGAEKLAKVKRAKKGEEPTPAVIGSTTWKRLQELIQQSDGKPVIALETDPRPAIRSKAEGFEDVPDDCSDLF